MGSTLISISVAVKQNRKKDDYKESSKGEKINEELILESPYFINTKSADKSFSSSIFNKKSAKTGKIAKFRDRDKDDQQQPPVLFTSMVSHSFCLSMKPFRSYCLRCRVNIYTICA